MEVNGLHAEPRSLRTAEELFLRSHVSSARSGPSEGNAMTKTIGGVPVRSRVPLAAWAFAGLLMLLSLLFIPNGHLSASASKQVATSAQEARHASVIW